jgi:hypothetical protein
MMKNAGKHVESLQRNGLLESAVYCKKSSPSYREMEKPVLGRELMEHD